LYPIKREFVAQKLEVGCLGSTETQQGTKQTTCHLRLSKR
jgi:hypothetical protein